METRRGTDDGGAFAALTETGLVFRLGPGLAPGPFLVKRRRRYSMRKLRPGSAMCRSAMTVSPAIMVCPSATIGGTPSGR